VIARLVLRNLLYRPWRSAVLFIGFGLGVAVMVVLLSIGQAMVTQAQDERLVGGGDVTVLPEGIDIEVMKTGGLGGLFFSISNARFIDLQLIAAPRLASLIRAVAPQSDDKLVYLTSRDGRERAVQATGEIPSATSRVGAAPTLAAGAWTDDAGDRRWADPTPAELEQDVDHFHLPPPGLANPQSWAEWHYFNIVSRDRRHWVFLSYILGGEIGHGRWGAQVLVTTHDAPRADAAAHVTRYSDTAGPAHIQFSTNSPDLRVGRSSVTLRPDGRYAVHVVAGAEHGTGRLTADLIIAPRPRAYFPGTEIAAEDFASGYTVPALAADGTGRVCVDDQCEEFDSTQAYHDHNWGVWRGVTWEWGAARAGSLALLYGRVQPPDSLGASSPLFVYLVDSLGFRAAFRPSAVVYDDDRTILVDGRPVRVPSQARFSDIRGADTLRVELTVEDAVGTDTRRPLIERGATAAARRLAHPYFIQMKGLARVSGRVGGAPIGGEGTGFFETYR
jgi:hypothetical protein